MFAIFLVGGVKLTQEKQHLANEIHLKFLKIKQSYNECDVRCRKGEFNAKKMWPSHKFVTVLIKFLSMCFVLFRSVQSSFACLKLFAIYKNNYKNGFTSEILINSNGTKYYMH